MNNAIFPRTSGFEAESKTYTIVLLCASTIISDSHTLDNTINLEHRGRRRQTAIDGRGIFWLPDFSLILCTSAFSYSNFDFNRIQLVCLIIDFPHPSN